MLDILSAVLSRSGADRRERVAEPEGGPLSGRSDRNGLVVHGGRSAPFRLLALAQQGLMGECDLRLPVGAQVDISIDGGTPVTAVLRWVRDNRFGAQLGSPLNRVADPAARRKLRQPRFRTDLQGTARYGAVAIPMRLRNISSQGCLIEAALLPRLGHRVEIELPDHPPLCGRVRWSRMGRAGLLLDAPLTDDQLLHLIPPQPHAASPEGKGSPLGVAAAARSSLPVRVEHIGPCTMMGSS